MKHERRRDRVWKLILDKFRRTGEVTLSEIDVTLTVDAATYFGDEDMASVAEKDDEPTVKKKPNGEGYFVEVDPDASEGTKRHVLNTMCGDRFRLAEKGEPRSGTWYIGPHLEYLFGQRDDTPVTEPFDPEFEATWENVDDVDMYSERRRDRLWLQVLNYVSQDKWVKPDELDASVTVVTDEKSTAYRVVEQEAYRTEDDVDTRDGKYVVAAEPDVAHSTKVSLLRTLEKDRYGILTDAGHYDGWKPGPWARAIFDIEIDLANVPQPRAREMTEELIHDDSLDPTERTDQLETLFRGDS